MTTSSLQPGKELLLKNHQARLERTLAFATELAARLRRDLEVLWTDPTVVPGGVAGAGARQLSPPDLGRFRERVDALAARAADGRAFLARVAEHGLNERLAALEAFDVEGLMASASGLEGQAGQLRHDPAVRRAMARHLGLGAGAAERGGPATRPAPARPAAQTPAPATAGLTALTGRLHRWAEKVVVQDVSPAVARATAAITAGLPAGPTRRLPAEAPPSKLRGLFEATHTFVGEVLRRVTPRVQLLQVGLEGVGLPGRRVAWAEVPPRLQKGAQAQSVPPEHHQWLSPLAKVLWTDPTAVQRAHGAVVQWTDCRGRHGAAEALVPQLDRLPPASLDASLQVFGLGPYKASALPLTHLHLQFKGMKVLSQLFPPPVETALR